MVETVIVSETRATFNTIWVEQHTVSIYTEWETEYINTSYMYTCMYKDKYT